MEEIFRFFGVGDVDERRAVQLVHAGERIERRQAFAGHRIVSQRVVADEEDVPIPGIALDHGLVRRAVLKAVEADEPHVLVRIAAAGRGLTRRRLDHRGGSAGLSSERGADDADGAGTYPGEYLPAADGDP